MCFEKTMADIKNGQLACNQSNVYSPYYKSQISDLTIL